MRLSLSVRIAEGFLSKEEATMSLEDVADVAVQAGYSSICMRASQVGIQSSADDIRDARRTLETHDLGVSMVTGDFDIVYNNDDGPNCLRDISPYLDLAEALGAPLLRVCMKTADDFTFARRAADQAAERGLKLAHQCHIQSPFETVDEIIETLREIGRPNFGLIFEPANLESCRQDYGPQTIRRLAPWIVNVYLQNQRVTPNGSITLETWTYGPVSFDLLQIPQSGGIDFDRVFRGLDEIGYDGVVTVHQSAPSDDSMTAAAAARQTAEFIRAKAIREN